MLNPDGSFTEVDRNRYVVLYAKSNPAGIARMVAITDRNRNRMEFLYDNEGRLASAIDTLGRSMTYAYDAEGRLTNVQDYVGRQVRFEYDANDDLVVAAAR